MIGNDDGGNDNGSNDNDGNDNDDKITIIKLPQPVDNYAHSHRHVILMMIVMILMMMVMILMMIVMILIDRSID